MWGNIYNVSQTCYVGDIMSTSPQFVYMLATFRFILDLWHHHTTIEPVWCDTHNPVNCYQLVIICWLSAAWDDHKQISNSSILLSVYLWFHHLLIDRIIVHLCIEWNLGTNHGKSGFIWSVWYATHSFKSWYYLYQEWNGL